MDIDELHHANEKNCTWKEVSRTRVATTKHKKYNQTYQMGTDSFPLLSNRYGPLCNYSEGDDTPINTLVLGMSKPRHAGKHKTNHKKRVL
jgi:hypothetical protein